MYRGKRDTTRKISCSILFSTTFQVISRNFGLLFGQCSMLYPHSSITTNQTDTVDWAEHITVQYLIISTIFWLIKPSKSRFLLAAPVPDVGRPAEKEPPKATAAAASPVRPAATAVVTSHGKYRSDGRCGAEAPLEDGTTLAECDPNSEYWCCSAHGFCGGSQVRLRRRRHHPWIKHRNAWNFADFKRKMEKRMNK